MTTVFPAALDNFTNPTPGQSQNEALVRTHSEMHGDLNDAMEAVQAAMGVTGGTGALGLRANLAAADGAALLGFTQTGVSSAVRTVRDKLHELPSVMDKIPLAEHAAIYARTSTYDCTAAIQAAVDDYPRCTAPAGTFPTSGEITIPAGHELIGAGMHATKFARAGSTLSFFVMGTNAGLSEVGFTRIGAVAALAGSLIRVPASGCRLSGIAADHAWMGIYVPTCSGLFLNRIYINNWQHAGIAAEAPTNDVYLSQFLLTHVGGGGTGILLYNNVEAFVASNGAVLGGQWGLKTAAASYVVGARTYPCYCTFTNVFFDSSTDGVLLDDCESIQFGNCWFSNRPGNGVTVGRSMGVSFENCIAAFCGAGGFKISHASAKHTHFTNCRAFNNNAQNVAASGFDIAAGVCDFAIIGGAASNPVAGGLQQNGINIAAGASDRFVIQGVNVAGNASVGISDGGTGTDKRITGNPGHVPTFTAPAFLNGWVNVGAGNQEAGYRKDADGRVWLRGRISTGSLAAAAFQLPAGYRPSATESFAVVSNNAFGWAFVGITGDVVPQAGSNVAFNLDGISFLAGA